VGQLADRARLDGRAALRHGLQVDIIPATGTDYFTTNIEDGIALADEALRASLRRRLPGGLGPDPGAASLHDRRCSASTSTPTCCPSPTSRLPPPFLLRPDP
jgi:hypothetical protein